MKKGGVLLFALLIAFFMTSLILAEVGDEGAENSGTTDADTTDAGTTDTETEDSDDSEDNIDDAEAGFACLIEKVDDDCSDASTIQELALTILASPEDVTEQCVRKLKDRKSGECWGDSGCNVRDSALAILALDHVNEDTTDAEEWLIEQNKTASDLIWYLQEDSDGETQCKFSYVHDGDAKEYIINVGETKRLDGNAGSCLSLARSSFWYRISSDCYDDTFEIECNKDFIASLLYSEKTTPGTFFLLSDTPSSDAYDTIELKLNSNCFGPGNGCSYEDTAWASVALLKTNHEVDSYLPYLIAATEKNKKYLPEAFVYALTGYDDYATNLIKEKGELRDYWLARNSAYDKYYDTALAILALESSASEEIDSARDWLYFIQNENGCWGPEDSEIVDTAMVLWALESRGYSGGGGVGGITTCEEADYFCVPRLDCNSEDVLPEDNFFCSGISDVCCETENVLSCDSYNGEVCASGFVCDGQVRNSLEGRCCLSSCEEASDDNECEDEGYICRSSCFDNEESNLFDCGNNDFCCEPSGDEPPKKVNIWLWILLILIIVVLVFFGWMYRAKLKVLWFKLRSGFKKDKDRKGRGRGGSGPPGRPGMPPRPGFPPIRRRPPIMPPKRNLPPMNHDRKNEVDPVFKKLQDLAK